MVGRRGCVSLLQVMLLSNTEAPLSGSSGFMALIHITISSCDRILGLAGYSVGGTSC